MPTKASTHHWELKSGDRKCYLTVVNYGKLSDPIVQRLEHFKKGVKNSQCYHICIPPVRFSKIESPHDGDVKSYRVHRHPSKPCLEGKGERSHYVSCEWTMKPPLLIRNIPITTMKPPLIN